MNVADLDKTDTDAPLFASDAFRLSDFQADLIEKTRKFGKKYLAPRADTRAT